MNSTKMTSHIPSNKIYKNDIVAKSLGGPSHNEITQSSKRGATETRGTVNYPQSSKRGAKDNKGAKEKGRNNQSVSQFLSYES